MLMGQQQPLWLFRRVYCIRKMPRSLLRGSSLDWLDHGLYLDDALSTGGILLEIFVLLSSWKISVALSPLDHIVRLAGKILRSMGLILYL